MDVFFFFLPFKWTPVHYIPETWLFEWNSQRNLFLAVNGSASSNFEIHLGHGFAMVTICRGSDYPFKFTSTDDYSDNICPLNCSNTWHAATFHSHAFKLNPQRKFDWIRLEWIPEDVFCKAYIDWLMSVQDYISKQIYIRWKKLTLRGKSYLYNPTLQLNFFVI